MHRFIPRIIIICLVIVAPLCATFFFKTLPPKQLLAYLLTNTVLFIILSRSYAVKSSQLRYRVQTGQELLNMSQSDHQKEVQQHAALGERVTRYSGLKKIIEDLNQQLDPNKVSFKLASSAYALAAERKGACSLFLLDQAGHRLVFMNGFGQEAEAQDPREADMLDWWVVKHQVPLFIEDISRDFRFDLERVMGSSHRFSSAIIAPLMAGKTLMGVLRLDHADTAAF